MGMGKAGEADARAFIRLLRDDDLRGFLSRELFHELDRAAFEGVDLPEGIDAGLAWESLNGARRLLGTRVVSALTNPSYASVWFVETPEMCRALAGLEGAAGEGSSLCAALRRHRRSLAATRPLVDEVASALQRDGVRCDPDSLRALLAGNRAPSSAQDRLVANLLGILGDLDHDSRAGLDVRRMSGIEDRLRQGVEGPLGVSPTATARPQMPYYLEDADAASVVRAMEEVYLPRSPRRMDPIVTAVSCSDLVWEYRPFGDVSGLMELALRATFLFEAGLPALAICPFGDLNLRWERGELSEGDAPFDIQRTGFESSFGVDVTAFYLQKVRLMERALARLGDVVDGMERQGARLRRAIDVDPRLNHRQRALLARLVDEPDMTVTVRSYEGEAGVSTVTARTDLQKLVELDYLYRRADAREGCFGACPDLALKLEALRARVEGRPREQ
jgi:hypothetical protein